MHEVTVREMRPDRFRQLLPPQQFEEFLGAARDARECLQGRSVWNVNSAASGGGVVELLRSLVGYARGVGIDARWVVIDADPAFFAVTKCLHNHLHGAVCGEGSLDDESRALYERTSAENFRAFRTMLCAGDVVIVHDPQPAGMIPWLVEAGMTVVWRCHVGIDRANDLAHEAWRFLGTYVAPAELVIFSREVFAWDGLDRERIVVIRPSIDPLAPKNQDLAPEVVRAILQTTGLLPGDPSVPAAFTRLGHRGHVQRRSTIVEDEVVPVDVPVVVQVSRWDALKDPLGVIRGFAEHIAPITTAHLLYAGPSVDAVADDPEGSAVLRQAVQLRAGLPADVRLRVHLASLPTEDADENAIIVNALQRHATVVVQKSLAEGFGLTVAEAMWKARPVVASRIGGIQEQIEHGVTGLLVDDPSDLAGFGAAVCGLLANPDDARLMGVRAHQAIRERFLSVRGLEDYFRLLPRLILR